MKDLVPQSTTELPQEVKIELQQQQNQESVKPFRFKNKSHLGLTLFVYNLKTQKVSKVELTPKKDAQKTFDLTEQLKNSDVEEQLEVGNDGVKVVPKRPHPFEKLITGFKVHPSQSEFHILDYELPAWKLNYNAAKKHFQKKGLKVVD